MDTQLAMAVLNEALEKYPHPEIFNTDQGRATDSICIERFWRSAKRERIYLNAYQSIGDLITDMDDYIASKIPSNLKLQKTNERVPRKYKIKPEKEEDRLDVLYKKF